jgi:hypothetical protein
LLVAQAKLASSPSHGGEGLLLTNGEEEREKVMIRYGRSSEGILSLYSIITRERESDSSKEMGKQEVQLQMR